MKDAKRHQAKTPAQSDDAESSPAPAGKPAPVAKPGPPPAGPPSAPPRQPDLSAGDAAGVDERTMTRLKRGQMRPEARLDLHGLTQDEAHRELSAFIAEARGASRRCVIVVTGKGRVSEGGGVLRRQVPQWLNAPGIRSHVLGFAHAQPRDGGAGALYVLLRRSR